MRRQTSCLICNYQPACIGGYWTFLPLFCCETMNVRKAVHRKKAAK